MNTKLKETFSPDLNISEIKSSPQPPSNALLITNSLENDKLFKSLKQELSQYTLEKTLTLAQQTLHPTKSPQWKQNFYHSLQTLLNEVLFTSTQQMRKILLTKVLNWYRLKTGKSPVPEIRNYHFSTFETNNEIYIPQKIEKTIAERKHVMTPYVPTKLQMDLDPEESQQSLFNVLLKTEEERSEVVLPKVKNKNRVPNLRPFSQLKGSELDQSPVFKDFRSSSRAKSTNVTRNESPDSFRYSYFGKSFGDKNEEICAVPYLRRLQIKEVMRIKKRMASKREVYPVEVLESGLVISDYRREVVSPVRFPKGGELLMVDSFGKVKARKKKKKKGKKNK